MTVVNTLLLVFHLAEHLSCFKFSTDYCGKLSREVSWAMNYEWPAFFLPKLHFEMKRKTNKGCHLVIWFWKTCGKYTCVESSQAERSPWLEISMNSHTILLKGKSYMYWETTCAWCAFVQLLLKERKDLVMQIFIDENWSDLQKGPYKTEWLN